MTTSASQPKLCTTCGARYAPDALFCPADGTPLVHAGNAGNVGPLGARGAAVAGPAGRTSEVGVDPYVGRELPGHIELRQLAGVGAMGRVYRAFQVGIDRDVAVKILHRELSFNAQLVARFHREARVASRLAHPNVVQVHLAGQLADGALYIVMEYLDGLSLQSALAASGGAMPLARALHIGLQLCDAVGEAHTQGVVHRDLKPENVMLVLRADDADYVKVLDFGIARLARGGSDPGGANAAAWGEPSMATAAGLIFGTARYISPEGAQGEVVGPAGDVYSVATLLFQMLAGRTPFEGDQAVTVLVQQIRDLPPPLGSIPRAAYVPEPIARAVMKNLAKNPGERDPDARAFGRSLLEAAVASGLSPDDLVARSALLAARGALQLPPLQRTKQLQLDRPLPAAPLDVTLDDALSPLPAATYRDLTPSSALSVATAPDFESGPPRSREGATEAPPERSPSSSFAPLLALTSTTSLPAPSLSMTPPSAPAPSRPATAPPSPAGVDASESFEAFVPSRSPGLRRAAIVVLCFLLGASGTALLASRTNLVAALAAAGGLTARPNPEPEPSPPLPSLAAPPPSEPAPSSDPRPASAAPRELPRLASGPTPAAPSIARTPKVAFELSPVAPRVGEVVELVASVDPTRLAPGARPLEAGIFQVVGSKAAGAKIASFGEDSGPHRVFRGHFTFPAVGTYELTFRSPVEGGALAQASRTVSVTAAVTAPRMPAVGSAPEEAVPPSAPVAPSDPKPSPPVNAEPPEVPSARWM